MRRLPLPPDPTLPSQELAPDACVDVVDLDGDEDNFPLEPEDKEDFFFGKKFSLVWTGLENKSNLALSVLCSKLVSESKDTRPLPQEECCFC